MHVKFALLLASTTLIGCAIDTPEYDSSSGSYCRSAFSLDSPRYAYFAYSGNLNGSAIAGIAVGTSSVPVNAPSTRQVIVGTEYFSLTINLVSSAYATKTIATNNPEVWMSAVTCSTYFLCSSERYIAGYYDATLRGSGTVTFSRQSDNSTRIVLNATLPNENTSVSQTLQFQNLSFTEACY